MFHLLPKINKRLENIPGRPVILNCGAPTEMVSKLLNHYLKPIIQKGCSYIKDRGDFLKKIKNLGSL